MMNEIYVIDTETSTTSFDPEPNGHIVEFGMVKVDLESWEVGEGYTMIINQPDVDFDAWVFKNTTLTPDMVRGGIEPSRAERFLSSMLECRELTAYNIAFDKLMIERDMPKINRTAKWGDCLMECASQIPEIPRRHANQNCYPKAEAAYNYLCPDDPCNLGGKERHRALDDARMEAHILIELYKRGLYEPRGYGQ